MVSQNATQVTENPRVPLLTPAERVERKAVLWAMWEARGLQKRYALSEELSPEENGLLLEAIAENEAAKAG